MKITFYLLAAGLLGVALLETLWIAASAAVRRRPVGAALLERWKNEELFFPHLLPQVRPRVGEALAYAFLVSELCWSAVVLLIDQAAPGMSEAWPAVVQAALSCALVLAKGLGCTEYSGRQLAALAALLFTAAQAIDLVTVLDEVKRELDKANRELALLRKESTGR